MTAVPAAPPSLLARVRAALDRHAPGPRTLLAAVSGGPDSLALLDLLARVVPGRGDTLVVAHADHGISPASADVAAAVAGVADTLGLPLETVALGLGAGASETRARAARWRWLREVAARRGALIVTAHHADDQAETTLMRLLRGSAPAGLAAMAPFAGGVLRPLLGATRGELERYVRERGLRPWLDPSNADPRHLRAWLRVEVLPALRRRLPDVDARLAHAAAAARDDVAAWDAALDALPGLAVRPEADGASADRAAFVALPAPLQRALLRAMARRIGAVLGPRRAGRAVAALATAGSGRRIELGGTLRLEVAFDRVRLARMAGTVPPAATLTGPRGTLQWGEWRLAWEPAEAPHIQPREGWEAWLPPGADPVIRPLEAGDRIRPLGGRGRRLVVRCLQDARVAASRRAGWPVVTVRGTLTWVPGVCRAGDELPAAGASAIRVRCDHHPG